MAECRHALPDWRTHPVWWLRARLFRRQFSPDPFEALALQLRLARLAGEIAGLQRDERQYAKALHLQAALAAYDKVLDQACELAGIPVEAAEAGAVHRLLAELALRERGWTW